VSDLWWESAVVYEIYPRSFQDSDGDGIGDLRGIISRLEYLEWLGVDAIWLAPIYPSPLADFGYDVSDHTAIAPELGTDEDFDELIEAAHGRGIRVLLDLVVSHTSIEHPWFREHPEFYVWAEDGPPNRWIASFGGPAWSRDERTGRWYLHSFFPEQPDLDWRRAEVREAVGDVVAYWRGRGADGFRVDAVDRLMKDPELRDDPAAEDPFPLPVHPDQQMLSLVRSRDNPDIGIALAALREAAGPAPLIGEVYLPAERRRRYLEHLDQVFAFDLLHARWDSATLGAAVASAEAAGKVAWVTSNHDFPRVATRWGERNTRAAAMLLLTLGGSAFVYQGEEIGMVDGPGHEPPLDRFDRDRCRHPMQWDAGPAGGFSTVAPWLPAVDPARRNVADQRGDPGSLLQLVRDLISLRREMRGRPQLLEGAPGLLAFRRGAHTVALNCGDAPAAAPRRGKVLLTTAPGVDEARLAPGEGIVVVG
jgi:alpha-glucosidase